MALATEDTHRDSDDFSVLNDTGARTFILTPNSVSLIYEALVLLIEERREENPDDEEAGEEERALLSHFTSDHNAVELEEDADTI
jgi:hypothetical protein